MLRSLGLRVVEAAVSLAIASVLIWGLLLLTEGDPARRILVARGIHDPTAGQIEDFRVQAHLDESAPVQYAYWVSDLLHGDLGTSWRTGQPIADEFVSRIPATVVLAVTALAIAIAISLALALIPVIWRRPWLDHLGRLVAGAFIVIPNFLIALVFLDILVVRFGLGRVVADGTFATVGLPALALALGLAGYWSRILRTSLLDASTMAYLDVSAARGTSAARRTVSHVLRNALPAFLTVIGIGVASLLAGAPVIESLFTWPGVGRYTIEAIVARDLPVVQAYTLLAVALYIVVSLIVDLTLIVLDPRRAATRSTKRTAGSLATEAGVTA